MSMDRIAATRLPTSFTGAGYCASTTQRKPIVPARSRPGRHQQIFLVLVEPVGLREIPDRAQRLIRRASSDDGGSSMFVAVFIRPLRNISLQIEHSKCACRLREMHQHSRATRLTCPRSGSGIALRIPIIAPGIRFGHHSIARRIAIPIREADAYPPRRRRLVHLR